jgi:hypothetical protein
MGAEPHMPLPASDVPSAESRLRHLASIPGHYYLEKWRDEQRQVAAFACRIQRISPQSLTVSAPVGGDVGDLVVTYFEEFGVLRGRIARCLGFGFVVALQLSDRQQRRLAQRVDWFERHKNFAATEQRRHRRIAPRNPQSSLVLADGSQIKCFVIDMSVSGAAVSADILPEIGTPLALGASVGRVVRHLSPGFAIQFLQLAPWDQLEDWLIKPGEEWIMLD